MIIIGEKLNSSIPKTFEAMKNEDFDYILSQIKAQSGAGADFIDINTAVTGENERGLMKKIIGLVLENSDCGIMPDSPDISVIAECAADTRGRKMIVNSVHADGDMDTAAYIHSKTGADIICMPIKGGRIPESAEERLENAKFAVSEMKKRGVAAENLFIDILVQSAATDGAAARAALETVTLVSGALPGVRTVAGLSNVSFGLPRRARVNASFLSMAMSRGLSAAILDPLSPSVRSAYFSAAALLGEDEFCMDYISYCREEE
jgi:cobalamin-dependent methionine synthase I